jgi:nucleotide-binding universal stress UspA family protein
MRSIAIPVADREECAVALATAFELGKKLGADIVGYHIRPHKRSTDNNTRLAISSVWSQSGAWPEPAEKVAAKAAGYARRLFEQYVENHQYFLSQRHGSKAKPHAIWKEKLGTPDKLMSLLGPVNDLMIVSRPQKSGGIKGLMIMTTALLDSGIPVLVLPQKKTDIPFNHIAVAWNRGAQEAQAVHATLSLLQSAEKVTFLTMGDSPKHGPSAQEMANYLKSYGIKATATKVTGSGGAALVNGAKKVGADVLLAGAYTKGRLREMFFGGVTEYLTMKSDFPVILKHS